MHLKNFNMYICKTVIEATETKVYEDSAESMDTNFSPIFFCTRHLRFQ